MIISKKAVDFIIFCEVSSKETYTKKYSGIIWPGGDSGATVGIGYDLGYNNPTDITRDWIKEIGPVQTDILKMFSGLRGEKAKLTISGNKMAAKCEIPFQAAYNVFVNKSLPAYGRKALQAFPGLDQLTPDAVGAIVSLVYNRGSLLDGPRRVEMKNIVPLVAKKDYKGIATQLDRMKRLWNNGLVQRREKEAALVAGSQREYSKDELIEI